jgi:hypothetical protein
MRHPRGPEEVPILGIFRKLTIRGVLGAARNLLISRRIATSTQTE